MNMYKRCAPAVVVGACLAILAGCNESPPPTQAGTTATAPSVGTPPPVAAVPTPPPQVINDATSGSAKASPAETAKDSPATDPKGTLSAQEESKSMPMAGHGNNHSSPALGTDAKSTDAKTPDAKK